MLAYPEEPRRKTLLTRVVGTRGQTIELERSIYHAPRPEYHHKVPFDRGHLLVEGHKLKIERVYWQRGRLLHRASGPPPAAGAKALLHLDWPRRHLAMRAHAAMHLLMAAVLKGERGTFASGPSVVGGGGIRAGIRLREHPREALARIEASVNEWVQARLPVHAGYLARDALEVAMTGQPWALPSVAPGEPSLRVVRIGDVAIHPCDGPQVENTREIGRFEIQRAEPRKGLLQMQARVHGE